MEDDWLRALLNGDNVDVLWWDQAFPTPPAGAPEGEVVQEGASALNFELGPDNGYPADMYAEEATMMGACPPQTAGRLVQHSAGPFPVGENGDNTVNTDSLDPSLDWDLFLAKAAGAYQVPSLPMMSVGEYPADMHSAEATMMDAYPIQTAGLLAASQVPAATETMCPRDLQRAPQHNDEAVVEPATDLNSAASPAPAPAQKAPPTAPPPSSPPPSSAPSSSPATSPMPATSTGPKKREYKREVMTKMITKQQVLGAQMAAACIDVIGLVPVQRRQEAIDLFLRAAVIDPEPAGEPAEEDASPAATAAAAAASPEASGSKGKAKRKRGTTKAAKQATTADGELPPARMTLSHAAAIIKQMKERWL